MVIYSDGCEKRTTLIGGKPVEVVTFKTPEGFNEYKKTGKLPLRAHIVFPTIKIVPPKEKDAMATPALIYAVDNLGPYRFAELCGQILSQHFKGFYLGGIGSDGGIDAEVDNVFELKSPENIIGVWSPDETAPAFDTILPKGNNAVFQFKHIVVGRCGGQTKARSRIMSLYKTSKKKKSELHKKLIAKKPPNIYVLVTNIEINSIFRNNFIDQCNKENDQIEEIKIIGLDELETFISSNIQLRHMYFPTIYGFPKYNLKIKFSLTPSLSKPGVGFCAVSVLNVGELTSYIDSISLKMNNGWSIPLSVMPHMEGANNPNLKDPLLPGRSYHFFYPYDLVSDGIQQIEKKQNEKVFPYEVVVEDQIDNVYTERVWKWFEILNSST